MYLNDSILRVFDVRAKPGKVEILKKKLSDTSVDVVKDEPGNLGFFWGKPVIGRQRPGIYFSLAGPRFDPGTLWLKLAAIFPARGLRSAHRVLFDKAHQMSWQPR